MATERATLNAVVRSLAVLSSSWRCAGDWRQVERRQTTGHRDRGRLAQSARDQVSQFHAFQTCCVRSGSSTVHTDQQCTSLPLIEFLSTPHHLSVMFCVIFLSRCVSPPPQKIINILYQILCSRPKPVQNSAVDIRGVKHSYTTTTNLKKLIGQHCHFIFFLIAGFYFSFVLNPDIA